jgi:hypothetical protein
MCLPDETKKSFEVTSLPYRNTGFVSHEFSIEPQKSLADSPLSFHCFTMIEGRISWTVFHPQGFCLLFHRDIRFDLTFEGLAFIPFR